MGNSEQSHTVNDALSQHGAHRKYSVGHPNSCCLSLVPYVFEVVSCDVTDHPRRVHGTLLALKLRIMYIVSLVSQFLSHNMTMNFKKLYFEHRT